ncbi:hypothetical protein R3Q06_26995 [Rhodococcus erythropolis]|uniref:hypothetical protein n=1 Tax=Rhodococcus erythropolis TaxID=1833 RepID=UPI0029494BBA|nr:hypothetical protein [Rhodococcus erythropolis]MDV6277150.1 hypothetical protein [Rhodococcus erythropolis]
MVKDRGDNHGKDQTSDQLRIAVRAVAFQVERDVIATQPPQSIAGPLTLPFVYTATADLVPGTATVEMMTEHPNDQTVHPGVDTYVRVT